MRRPDGEEDDADDRAPKQGLMIPASMGLRFQVPEGLLDFTVTASWGTYESVRTEDVDRKGRPIRRCRRTPVESRVVAAGNHEPPSDATRRER